MRSFITGVIFNPATRELDFSAISGFKIEYLYSVKNLRTGETIYKTGQENRSQGHPSNIEYTAVTGNVVKLEYPTEQNMLSTDPLQIEYYSPAGAGSTVVTATDFDIRNLTFAQDKVDVSGSSVSLTGDIQIEIDAVDGDNIALADAAGNKVTTTDIGGTNRALDVNVVGNSENYLSSIATSTDGIDTKIGLNLSDNIIDAGTGINHSVRNALVGGIYKSTQPTLDDGDQSELVMDNKGNVKVAVENVVVTVVSTPVDIANFPTVQAVTGKITVESEHRTHDALPQQDRYGITLGGFKNSDPAEKFQEVFVVSNRLAVDAIGSVSVSNIPAVGQTNAANSLPVVLASNQTNVPVSVQGSASVDVSDVVMTGPTLAAPVAINTNIFNTFSTTAAYNVGSYRSVSFSIVTGASTNAVAVAFEGSNDNSNFVAVPLIDSNATTTAPVSTFNTAASTVRYFEGEIPYRFFRARLGAAITAGSIQVTGLLSQKPYIPRYNQSVIVAGTVNTVSSVTSASLAASVVADTASSAITTTTTSAGVSVINTQSISVVVPVTAVSGTNPTLDISIEESFDNTTFRKIYDFERITATGVYYSPLLKMNGTLYRLVQTVGGTTPSFTRSISSVRKQTSCDYIRRMINRSIDPNTLNSTTPSIHVEGCSRFEIVQSSAAGATVDPVIALQVSDDNVNWITTSTVVTCTASTNSRDSVINLAPKFVRGIVTTAGTGAVLKYISIKALEK